MLAGHSTKLGIKVGLFKKLDAPLKETRIFKDKNLEIPRLEFLTLKNGNSKNVKKKKWELNFLGPQKKYKKKFLKMGIPIFVLKMIKQILGFPCLLYSCNQKVLFGGFQ